MTLLPCAVCGANNVSRSWALPECGVCKAVWPTWRHYWMDVGSRGPSMTTRVTAIPEPEPEPNYVTSGQMQREIEKLLAEQEFAVIKRLAQNVANITQDSMEVKDDPQLTVDKLLLYITQEVKDALIKRALMEEGEAGG